MEQVSDYILDEILRGFCIYQHITNVSAFYERN